MNIEGLHTQVDNLQEEKLASDTWLDSDTPIQDIANRCIDDFQSSLRDLPQDKQKGGLVKLQVFLASLGANFEVTDLEILFEVLASEDSVEKQSLPNGLPMFGNDFYGDSKGLNMLLSGGGEAADVLPILFNELRYTQGGKQYNAITPERQNDLTKATEDLYQEVQEKLGISEEELHSYMIFGPKLLADMKSKEVGDYFSNPANKESKLTALKTQEEQLYFLRLWDFINSSPEDQREFMADDSAFANRLRSRGILRFMEYIEMPQFSQSAEIVTKKDEVYDMIIENCGEDDIPSVLAIYQVYLEFAGDSSKGVDSYMKKLGLFQDMLKDEFRGDWDIVTFVARLVSLGCKAGKFDMALAGIQNIRRGREYLRKNALESGIIAASFLPCYVGSCIDVGYSAYKLSNGVNFSGEAVPQEDACIQMGFGVIGLGLDAVSLGGSSVLKILKAFSKSSAEIQIIASVGKMISQFIPKLIRLFKKCEENLFSGAKQLKEFFMKNILPVIRDSLKKLLGNIPQLQGMV